jgi:hypothetical protein
MKNSEDIFIAKRIFFSDKSFDLSCLRRETLISSYSGRTKYSACASKLYKLSEEYLRTQKTQGAAVFFYSEELVRENDLKL